MILHLSHIFLTDALTFMVGPSLVTIRDAPAREIVGRKLYGHLVTGQDPDEVHTHLARNISKHLMIITIP